ATDFLLDAARAFEFVVRGRGVLARRLVLLIVRRFVASLRPPPGKRRSDDDDELQVVETPVHQGGSKQYQVFKYQVSDGATCHLDTFYLALHFLSSGCAMVLRIEVSAWTFSMRK